MQRVFDVIKRGPVVTGIDNSPLKEQQGRLKRGQSVWQESIAKSMHAGWPKIQQILIIHEDREL